MLKIEENPTFMAEAAINLKALQATFHVQCRLLDPDELDGLTTAWAGRKAKGETPAVAPTISDAQFIASFLCGFGEDVCDGAGAPMPYTPENVKRLLRVPGAKRAVIDGFFTGYEGAETKNSETPRAG